MPESGIQKKIMLALSEAGCTVWRNNTGRFLNPNGQLVKFGLCVGSSDLIGITPDGRFLAIEVKGNRGKVSEHQKNFINHVISKGGIAGVARSAEDAIRLLDTV